MVFLMINEFIRLIKTATLHHSGRFNRSEFASIIFVMPIVIISSIFVLVDLAEMLPVVDFLFILLLGLLLIVSVLSQLGACVLRLHDLNLSDWFVLLIFIPYVGFLMLLYLLLKKGKGVGETQWG